MGPEAPAAVIETHPEGATLPAGFAETLSSDTRAWVSGCTAERPCVATVRDLDGDGDEEVLLNNVGSRALGVFAKSGEDWVQVGGYATAVPCDGVWDETAVAEAVREGRLTPAPSRWPDLVIGEEQTIFQPSRDCPAATAEPTEAPTP